MSSFFLFFFDEVNAHLSVDMCVCVQATNMSVNENLSFLLVRRVKYLTIFDLMFFFSSFILFFSFFLIEGDGK